MATFNSEKHIGSQLQSLCEQTVAPIEVVVSDDASSDDTVAIVAECAARAAFPIILNRNPVHLGWQRNFVQAARQCTGDIIAFCDHDDYWLPGKVQAIVEAAARWPWAALVHGNYFMFERSLTSVHTNLGNGANFAKSAVFYGGFDGHRLAFRRELLPWLEFQEEFSDSLFDGKIAHDRLVMLAALTVGNAIYLDEPLTLFRRHPGQVTSGTERRSTTVEYRHRSRVLREWVITLQKIRQAGLSSEPGTAAMARVLTRLANALESRAELRESEAFSKRAGRFATMLAHHAYGSKDTGGLGIRSFARDATSLWRHDKAMR